MEEIFAFAEENTEAEILDEMCAIRCQKRIAMDEQGIFHLR